MCYGKINFHADWYPLVPSSFITFHLVPVVVSPLVAAKPKGRYIVAQQHAGHDEFGKGDAIEKRQGSIGEKWGTEWAVRVHERRS